MVLVRALGPADIHLDGHARRDGSVRVLHLDGEVMGGLAPVGQGGFDGGQLLIADRELRRDGRAAGLEELDGGGLRPHDVSGVEQVLEHEGVNRIAHGVDRAAEVRAVQVPGQQ